MKITDVIALGVAVAALAVAPAYGQGKGGGNSNAGGGKGPDSGRPAPEASRPEAPDRKPDSKPHPKPQGGADNATVDDGKGPAKGQRSASTAAHGLAGSMHEINQTSFAQRRELHDSLDMRLKSSRDALKQVQADAKHLRADARNDFKAALDGVKSRDKELENALKSSRKATEANWDTQRESLARAHRNHADAVARLEAIPRPPRP